MHSSLIFLLIFGFWPSTTFAGYCYSCSGVCKSELCNCEMGYCEADYCFTEKRHDESAGISRIIKGCVKRPSRRMLGCDYDRNKDTIACVCVGDFCNDVVHMRHQLRRNITCKNCEERDSDCSETCTGQWCYESTNGKTGCGVGPPKLPFFYETSELLMHRTKVCMTFSRGNSLPSRHCICNTHLCNYDRPLMGNIVPQQRSRSIVYNPDQAPPKIYKCISCDVSTQDSSITTSCRQNSCYGHYCTYASQRTLFAGPNHRSPSQAIIHERHGCINVTDHRNVQLGCVHKWTNNEEELKCVCTGNDCNVDVLTASLAIQFTLSLKLITCCCFFLLFNKRLSLFLQKS